MRIMRNAVRKVTALLRMEGWRVNHKKVERLWNEEGLLCTCLSDPIYSRCKLLDGAR